MNDYEPEAKLFKVLMHPARLAILNVLRDGEHCVCHLEAALGHRQAYISQQLAALREAGLVQDRREGWNIFYRVVESEVFKVIEAAQGLTGSPESKPGHAGKLANCLCPHCHPQTELAAW
jgi:ArsR family transcriptional regulator